MLIEYILKALERARYKTLDNGTWFGEIPGFVGVWANAETEEDCKKELSEVLQEWLIFKLRDNDDDIPVVEGIDLTIKEVSIN